MPNPFGLARLSTIEFGLGRVHHRERGYFHVPVDSSTQEALLGMLVATAEQFASLDAIGEVGLYDPSDKHGEKEHLLFPLSDDHMVEVAELHAAENLPIDSDPLRSTKEIFCYFARFIDNRGRRVTAIRRAAQFKGVLDHHFLRFSNNALRTIDDEVVKLDSDFDLVVAGNHVEILRPAAFESLCQLNDMIIAAVPQNLSALQSRLSFMDLSDVAEYASSHPRAARYIASIQAANAAAGVDKKRLKALCLATGVSLVESQGKLYVGKKDVLGFLEVLDRRRYELELVKDSPEQFRAPSRKRITL